MMMRLSLFLIVSCIAVCMVGHAQAGESGVPFSMFPPQLLTKTRGWQYSSVIQNFPVQGLMIIQPLGNNNFIEFENLTIPSMPIPLPQSWIVSDAATFTNTQYISMSSQCDASVQNPVCSGWSSSDSYSWYIIHLFLSFFFFFSFFFILFFFFSQKKVPNLRYYSCLPVFIRRFQLHRDVLEDQPHLPQPAHPDHLRLH